MKTAEEKYLAAQLMTQEELFRNEKRTVAEHLLN